ncbi:lamin tail domain-containing protein [Hyalangium rubrum]|uniref:Lamin tail domain-containing protein n=1 Tax=Hyalangium rubrum TaxID=3103134 RepID=A0ABU5H9N6_9BACT|nr:lamin tail domain-containing protein [Hyalangium sp. s54d21]MDY7230208.1 lamin tail domain-containing protein [Hyalangium sp. s54d21]
MSLRASLRHTALLAVVLLCLPGAAWAQVALSGQVHFADGSIAAGVTVYAKAGNITHRATTDASGNYLLQFAAGTYDVGVSFNSNGFSGSQTLFSAQPFSSNTTLNLITSDILLNGRILNSSGQPVPDIRMTGYVYGGDSWNDLFPVSGADGRFQVRMLPGTYTNVRLQPPSGSSYVLTPLPNQTFTASLSKDFTLASTITLSGQVHFADGSIAVGTSVYAEAGNIIHRATTDAFGNYMLQLAAGTYDVGVSFNSNGFSGSQTLFSAQPLSSNAILNLTTSDILLNGRIINSSGQPVPDVRMTGYVYGGNSWNDLFPVSGADGRFQVRMLPGTYTNVRLQPPSGSSYVLTPLPNQTFTASLSKDFTLAGTITLSGQVHFADGSIAAGTSVYAEAGNIIHRATTDASGNYLLQLAAGTYDVGVSFNSNGFSGSQTLFSAQPFSSNTTLNLTTSDILLNGRIINSSGQPVPDVRMTGYVYGGNSWNDLYPVSGADGRFQIRLLPGTYTNVQLQPLSGSSYLLTPLSNQTFSASLSKEFLVADSNECALNNGGCSVNATCTNIPGSFTCTCNPGYTGDGFSCVVIPATVTLTSPNGGEQWATDSVQNITWSASGLSNVDLHYSLDNGASWTLIAANVSAASGAYAWTLPTSTSTSARVRVANALDGNPSDISNAAFSLVAPARLVLNEILANEPGSATAGEFIEVVNVGGTSLDLSGWALWDATAVRHTFPSGTVLPAGKALVVFGGASGIPAGVPNAVAATTGGLNLGNSGDTVTVKNAAGASIDSYTYGSTLASADGVSMNRSPDATAGASFVLHNALSTLSASAGKRANGSAF